MKKIAISFALIIGVVLLSVATGPQADVGIKLKKYDNIPYALCAASATTPTSKHMVINEVRYRVGLSVCPIEVGAAFANLSLTEGKLAPQGNGTIWSLFGTVATFPQQQPDGTWIVQPAKVRAFKTSETLGGASSNMWSMPCKILRQKISATNGQQYKVALCRGPMMENVNNKPIAFGTTVFTQAAVGLKNPIVAQLPLR